MINIQKLTKADTVGAAASSLCIVHCMAAPFIFMAGAYSAAHAHTPVWWQLLDYLFLVISFIAIRRSAKASTKNWMGYTMTITWALLFLAVFNETLEMAELSELVVYIPAFGLIGLHLYNQKYCTCTGSDCCAR